MPVRLKVDDLISDTTMPLSSREPRGRIETLKMRWNIARSVKVSTIRKFMTEETASATTLRVKLRAWRGGFTSSSYLLYDLDRNDARLYLSDTARYGRATGQLHRILQDKVLFSAVVGAHARVPSILAIVVRGRVIPTVTPPAVSDVRSLIDYCERGPGVIFKPARGSRGRGVTGLTVSTHLEMNGRRTSVEELTQLIEGLEDHIVVDRVEQAGYAASIFPGAANTLRIITMQDPDDGHRPFIPVAVHRFGVGESIPTDNWSRGGLISKIDLESGRLGPAGRHPRFAAGDVDVHPETGATIAGVQIPGWLDIQAMVLRLAETLRFLTLVGWDVIVTDDGPVVVEGNHAPDREIQKWHPFLADPRVRRYFEHRGVI